jgi:processive 1,2-diacylglycerol beta-glucosyltransferase
VSENKILILHATVGGGHKSAARALAKAFSEADPTLEVQVVDALDGMSASFRKMYAGGFEKAVAHTPTFYGAFFKATRDLDRSPVFRFARHWSNRLQGRKLVELLRESNPRAIVCTHFLPLEIALREKEAGWITAPVYAVVTDYVTHGFWRQADADGTFCPPGRALFDLVEGGVPADRITSCGIPIDPTYGDAYELAAAKRRGGLPLSRPTIVLLAGGAGMGPLVQVLESTARATRGAAEIVVVCGKNEKLREEAARAAQELAAPVRVLGFVDPIADLLRAADVVVTKPGGLTTSECLALGKPTVFYEAAPGQESANAEHVVGRSAGVFGGSPERAGQLAAELATDAAARDRLARRARRIARPNAAREIVERVLSRAEPAVLAA